MTHEQSNIRRNLQQDVMFHVSPIEKVKMVQMYNLKKKKSIKKKKKEKTGHKKREREKKKKKRESSTEKIIMCSCGKRK